MDKISGLCVQLPPVNETHHTIDQKLEDLYLIAKYAVEEEFPQQCVPMAFAGERPLPYPAHRRNPEWFSRESATRPIRDDDTAAEVPAERQSAQQ